MRNQFGVLVGSLVIAFTIIGSQRIGRAAQAANDEKQTVTHAYIECLKKSAANPVNKVLVHDAAAWVISNCTAEYQKLIVIWTNGESSDVRAATLKSIEESFGPHSRNVKMIMLREGIRWPEDATKTLTEILER
jgi:hypothetical protein